jgi:hypothetical protein
MESPSLSGSEIAKRVHTLLPSELRFHDLSHVLQTNAWAEGKYFTASLEPFARSNRLLFEAMQASALETANHCDVTRDYMDGSRDYVEDLLPPVEGVSRYVGHLRVSFSVCTIKRKWSVAGLCRRVPSPHRHLCDQVL